MSEHRGGGINMKTPIFQLLMSPWTRKDGVKTSAGLLNSLLDTSKLSIIKKGSAFKKLRGRYRN